jgi:hypothetical protein
MGYAKNYHLRLLEACAPENGFAQEAIDYALKLNLVHTTGEDFDADVRAIMARYDEILNAYRCLIQPKAA